MLMNEAKSITAIQACICEQRADSETPVVKAKIQAARWVSFQAQPKKRSNEKSH
jgi:hypothetical protein